jgi:predicted small metal-binding protein
LINQTKKILALVFWRVHPKGEGDDPGNTLRGKMLIRYSCKDMGLNCPYILKGETLEEVTEKALQHVREKHQEDFNIISSPAQIEEMKKALARSTRVVVG